MSTAEQSGDSRRRDPSPFQTPTVMETTTVPATNEATAIFLRDLADHLEANPDDVLIGLWSTGFGEPDEAVFQVVIERYVADVSGSSARPPEPV